jgi:hypothetical protein
VTVWLTDDEHRTLTAALDTVLPGDGISPGAGEMGGADYVDQLLGAFSFDPPRLWAGGPFSGRMGGEASFDQWLEVGALDELAWRTRLEGSLGRPEREFNGPVVGWQERYRDALAALGADLADLDGDARRARLHERTDDAFRELLFEHACESLYGDPVYGGNRDRQAWDAIAFDGDVQPRGWTDDEVTNPS